MRLDHVVIMVTDLNSAVRDYTARGFTVTPGGEHTHGNTHNALVTFADGAYLELLAFKTLQVTQHRWQRYRAFPGAVDYCLGCGSIAPAVQAIAQRGLTYSDGSDSGRLRPDGVELRWRGSNAPSQERGLPFLIEDVTPRELRVPGGAASQHANGVVGIAQLEVLVSDLAQARADFAALLGATPREEDGALTCDLNGTTLHITVPLNGSPAAQRLQTRGAGPWQVIYRMADGTRAAV